MVIMTEPVMSERVMGYPPTPELERLTAIINSGQARAVQDFLDWLRAGGLHIASYHKIEGMRDEWLLPDPRGPEQMMADHFGIDQTKIEDERRALLAALRGEQS